MVTVDLVPRAASLSFHHGALLMCGLESWNVVYCI